MGSLVRLWKISVAITFVVALLFVPLAQMAASDACGTFGVSAARAKSCHGCCAQMKCCADAKDSDKSQPLQGSNTRAETGALLAVVIHPVVLLYSMPIGREDFRPVVQNFSAPVFSSLSRLCIRLV